MTLATSPSGIPARHLTRRAARARTIHLLCGPYGSRLIVPMTTWHAAAAAVAAVSVTALLVLICGGTPATATAAAAVTACGIVGIWQVVRNTAVTVPPGILLTPDAAQDLQGLLLDAVATIRTLDLDARDQALPLLRTLVAAAAVLVLDPFQPHARDAFRDRLDTLTTFSHDYQAQAARRLAARHAPRFADRSDIDDLIAVLSPPPAGDGADPAPHPDTDGPAAVSPPTGPLADHTTP